MSLVTYDLSDSEDEEVEESTIIDNNQQQNSDTKTNGKIESPKKREAENDEGNDLSVITSMFQELPKPKSVSANENIDEDDNIPLPVKDKVFEEKKAGKTKNIVQITVPSLSEFKDVEESKKEKPVQVATKKSSLFSLLPPPRSQTSKPLIPQILNKKPNQPSKPNPPKVPSKSALTKVETKSLQPTTKSLGANLVGSNYDSDSEDEDIETKPTTTTSTTKSNTKLDFFSLTSTSNELSTNDLEKLQKETEEMTAKYLQKRQNKLEGKPNLEVGGEQTNMENEASSSSSTSAKSSFKLNKEDILQKNKVEVGPKLPVPEQDYNLDETGNLALDEKAIQYLCGKRGVKRKNEELESASIIEINGEDIKPDEREWLVKALTENPIHRPASLGAGPGGQSKKKHQITYLAHQAKAMELELQNQWAQNRLTRQQTQSKYGF